jgi:hypothetical protein
MSDIAYIMKKKRKDSVIRIKGVGSLGVKATKGTKGNDQFVPFDIKSSSDSYYADGGKGDSDYLYLPYDIRDITRLQVSSSNNVHKDALYFDFDNIEETPVGYLKTAGGKFSLKNIEYIVGSNGTLKVSKTGLRLSDWRPDNITGIIPSQSTYAPDTGVWRVHDFVGRISMTSSTGRAFAISGNTIYLDSNSDGTERDANGRYEKKIGRFRGLENSWYKSSDEYKNIFAAQSSWAIYQDSNLGILFNQDGAISGWLSLDI